MNEEIILILLLRKLQRQNARSFNVLSEKSVAFPGGLPLTSKTSKTPKTPKTSKKPVELPPLSPRKSPEISGMVAPLSSLSFKHSMRTSSSPRVSPLPPLKSSPLKSSPLKTSTASPRVSPLPPLKSSPLKTSTPSPRVSPLPPLKRPSPKSSPLKRPPLKTFTPLPPLKSSPLKSSPKSSPLNFSGSKLLPAVTSTSPLPIKKTLPPLSKLTPLK